MNEKILKVSSITKKLLVGLFGAFLLVFLLFHMAANLLILVDDGGDSYSAFCHFMGTNIIVKIAEIGLLVTFLLHICLSVVLYVQNRGKRPVRYHQPSRTKTAKGSKLAIVSGSLLFVLLIFHFYDFYFVKKNIVKGGHYMVKTEEFVISDPNQEVSEEAQIIVMQAIQDQKISKDGQWLRDLNYNDKEVLQQTFPEAKFEPDFYNTAREKFSILHIVIAYLVFFFVVGLHIRHGFESAFQTFGLNHYKYSRLIEILGIIYCWVVCIGFAIVPLTVYLLK